MNLFENIFGRRNGAGSNHAHSSQIAKERLQIALVADRVKISPELLQTVKEEIINVISKHFDIDRDAMEVTLGEQHDRLYCDIPMRRVRVRAK